MKSNLIKVGLAMAITVPLLALNNSNYIINVDAAPVVESGAALGPGFDLDHSCNLTADIHSRETRDLPLNGKTIHTIGGMIGAYVEAINILNGTDYTLLEVYTDLVQAHPELKESSKKQVYEYDDINKKYNIDYERAPSTIEEVKRVLSEGKIAACMVNTTKWLNEKGELWGKTGSHTGLIFYFDGTHYHMKTSVKPNAPYTESQLTDWLNDTSSRLVVYSRRSGSVNTSYNPIPSSSTPISASSGFREETYNGMRYCLSLPDNPTAAMPLVIFLHGKGEKKNMTKLKDLAVIKYVKSKKAYKVGNFVFIAPLLTEERWTPRSVERRVFNLIEKTVSDYKIDRKRIILTGMSLGAAGVWSYANHNQDYFAGIVPVSHASDGINISHFVNLPILARAGDTKHNIDEPTINKNMKDLIDNINKMSGKNLADFKTIKGATHGETQNKVFSDSEVYRWMLSQRKN